jgi:hypothetical protein
MDFKNILMKNYFKIIATFLTISFVVSCSTNDKFEGTPESNKLIIETITGVVSTNSTFALPGQYIDFTATIPQEFATMVNDTIDIEAVTKTIGGSIRKATVRLLKGENVVSGKILVGTGGGTFFMPVDLKLNAINIKNSFRGKQFLLSSNVITIDSGDSSVPSDNDSKLQIKVAWENLTTGNSIDCKISRIGSIALTLKGSITVTNPNPASSTITISGTTYPIQFNTDLSVSATNFANSNHDDILSTKGIEVSAVGKALLFEYTTVTPPVITIANASGTNLGGSVFSSVNFSPGGSPKVSKEFPIFNSQLASTSSTGLESILVAFNPGDYKISINAVALESSPKDLKYRVIIKQPNGTTQVFNGVYTGMTSTSGFKDVLKFKKIGLGDSAYYTAFVQL